MRLLLSKKKKKGRGKKRNRADKSYDEEASSSNRDIQKMFANMPIKKKKEVPVNLDEDDILGDLIQELDNSPRPGISKTPRLIHSKVSEKIKRENQTRGYLESFSTVLNSPRTSVNNTISKTENLKEKSENNNQKLNESNING